MKKLLLSAFALLSVSAFATSPVYLFQDDFESLPTNTTMGAANGYALWESSAKAYDVTDVTNMPVYVKDSLKVNGTSTKFVYLNGAAATKTAAFRKQGLQVIEGFTYMYEVKTYGQRALAHGIGINFGLTPSTAAGINLAIPATLKAEWTLRQLQITPTAAQASLAGMNVYVTQYQNAQGVYIDDMKVYEYIPSGINGTRLPSVAVAHIMETNNYKVMGDLEVAKVEVLNTTGNLVKTVTNSALFSMAEAAKGVYVVKVTDNAGKQYIAKIAKR